MATVHSKNSSTTQLPVQVVPPPSSKIETSSNTAVQFYPRDQYLLNAPHLNPDGSLKIQDPKPLVLPIPTDTENKDGFWGQSRTLEGFQWKWNLQALFAPFLKYCSRVKGEAVVIQGSFHLVGTFFWKSYLQKLGVQNPDEEMWNFSTEAPGLYEIYIRVPKDPQLEISTWVSIFLYFLAVQQFSEQLPFVGMMGELGLLTRLEPVVVDAKCADRLKLLKSVSEILKISYLKSSDSLEIPLDATSRIRIRITHADTELPIFPFQCDQLYMSLLTDDVRVIAKPNCPAGTPLKALNDKLLHRYEILFPQERSRFSWLQLWALITLQGPALIPESLVQELQNQPISTTDSEEILKLLPSSQEVQLVYCWHVSLHSPTPLWINKSEENTLSPLGQLLNRYQGYYKGFSSLLIWMGGLQLVLATNADAPRCRVVHQGNKTYLDISWKASRRLHLLCEFDLKLATNQLKEWLTTNRAKCLTAFCETLPLFLPSISACKLPSLESLSDFISVCEEIYPLLCQNTTYSSEALLLLEIRNVLKQQPAQFSDFEKILPLFPYLPSHEKLQQATESLVRLSESSPCKQLAEVLQRRLNGETKCTAEESTSIYLEEFLTSGEPVLVSRALSIVASLSAAETATFLIRIAPNLTATVIPLVLGRVCELCSPKSILSRQVRCELLKAYESPLKNLANISVLSSVQILASHALELQSTTRESYLTLADRIIPSEAKTELFRKEWEEINTFAQTPEMQPKVLFASLCNIQQKMSIDPKWKDDKQFVHLLLLALQDSEVQNSAGFVDFIQTLFTRLETQKQHDQIYIVLKEIKPRQGDKVFHPWAEKCLEFWISQNETAANLSARSSGLREAGYKDHLSTGFLLKLINYLVPSTSDDKVRKEVLEIKKYLHIEKTHKKAYVDLLLSLYANTPPSQLIEDVHKNLSLFAEHASSISAIQAQLNRVATYLREHTEDRSLWIRFSAFFEDLRKNASWRGVIVQMAETLTPEEFLKRLKLDHPLFALFLKSWNAFEKKLSDSEKIQLGEVLARVVCRCLEDREEEAVLKLLASGACTVAEMREKILTAVRRPPSLELYGHLVFVYALRRKTYLLEPLRWIGDQLRAVNVSPLHAEFTHVIAAVPIKELQSESKAWKPLLARLCLTSPELMPKLVTRLIDLGSGNEIAFFQECRTLLTQNPTEAGRRLTSYADTGTTPAQILPAQNTSIDSLIKQNKFNKQKVEQIIALAKETPLNGQQWEKLILRIEEWDAVFELLWQYWLQTHPSAEAQEADSELWKQWVNKLTLTSHEQPFVNDLVENHAFHLIKRLRLEEAKSICKICINFLVDFCVLNMQYNPRFYDASSQLINSTEIKAKIGCVTDLLEPKEKVLLVDLTMASHPDSKVQQQGRAQFFQKLAVKQFPPYIMFEYFCYKPFLVPTEDQATLWELAESVLKEVSTGEEIIQAGRWMTIVSGFNFPFICRGREIRVLTDLFAQYQRILQKMGRNLSQNSALISNVARTPLAFMQQTQKILQPSTNPLTQGITTFIDGSLKLLNMLLLQELSLLEKSKILDQLHPLLAQLESERTPVSQPAAKPSTRRNKRDQAASLGLLDRIGGNNLDEFQQAFMAGIQLAADEFGDKTPLETILKESDNILAQVARLRFRWINGALNVMRDLNHQSSEGSSPAECLQMVSILLPPAAFCFEQLSKAWDTNYGPCMEKLISIFPSIVLLSKGEPKLREPLFRAIASSFSVLNLLMVEQLDPSEKIELLRKYFISLQTFEEKSPPENSAQAKMERKEIVKLWLRWLEAGIHTLRQPQLHRAAGADLAPDMSMIKSVIPRIEGWYREADQNRDELTESLLEVMPLFWNVTQGDSLCKDQLLSLLHCLGGCPPVTTNLGQTLTQFERIYHLIGMINSTKLFTKKNLLLRALVRFLPPFVNLEEISDVDPQSESDQLAKDRIQLLATVISSPDMEMLTGDDWRSFLPALAPRVIHQLLDIFVKRKQFNDLLGISYIMYNSNLRDSTIGERLFEIVDQQVKPSLFDQPTANPKLSLLCRSRYTQGLYQMYTSSSNLSVTRCDLLKRHHITNLTMLLLKMTTASDHFYLLTDIQQVRLPSSRGKLSFRDLALEAVILGCCQGNEPSIVKQTVKLALKHMTDVDAFDSYIKPLMHLITHASLESLEVLQKEIAPVLNNFLHRLPTPVSAPNLARFHAASDVFETCLNSAVAESGVPALTPPKLKLIDLYELIKKKITEKEKNKTTG